MDLRLIGRAVAAHKVVATLGVIAAIGFAFLAHVRVTPFGDPMFEYRKSKVWSSTVVIQLTQQGFPEGRVVQAEDRRGALIQLAPLYASLANTQPVRTRMRKLGPIPGDVDIQPLVDANRFSLPLIRISSLTETRADALTRTKRQADALIGYIADQQAAARVRPANRVLLRVVNGPTRPTVAVPRKATLPVVVLLSMLIVTGGLILTLENLGSPGRKSGEPDTETRVPLEALQSPPADAPASVSRPSRPEPVVSGQAATGTAGRPGPMRTLRSDSGQDSG